MRSIRIIVILAALLVILIWLARTTPEEVLQGVIGGQASSSVKLLETGWGAGGGELVSFVHFRVNPKDLAP